MIYWLLFIIGLCIGSFLNVVIYRETRNEVKRFANLKVKKEGIGRYLPSWTKGRSVCDHCGRKIRWYDNIPLLSYLLLRGRCRFCKKKISFQYPLVEFLTGLEFVWIYFLVQKNLLFFSRFEGFYSFLSLFIWLVLGACLLTIFIADWQYQIIPDSSILAGSLAGFFKIWVDYFYTGMVDFSLLWSALGASLFLGGLVLITKGEGMGLGDIKLGFLMGLILGFPKIVSALFFSFLTGAGLGVILILLGRKKLKSQIAFGPFLIGGLVFSLIWGEAVWQWFSC